jgi:hypothetical protein
MFDWLPERIAAVQNTDTAREQGWQFVLNPPASEEDIERCEAALHLSLPPSYRAFLLRWNGASLFRREHVWPDGRISVSAEIGIGGTLASPQPAFGRLPTLNARLRADIPVPAEDWGSLIVAFNIPGPGACYCGLNPERSTAEGEYAVVDCDSDYGPYCWRQAVIAPSFEAWLRRAFDEDLATGNPWYWVGSPELQALYDACNAEMAARPRLPSPRPRNTTRVEVRVIRHVEGPRDGG